MAGVGGGGGPSSAPPRNTSEWVAVPPSRLSRPPQHQTEGERPPRPLPPQPGLYIQWFSAAPRRGRARPSQRDGGGDPGLLVRPGTHSLCRLFF